MFKSVNKLFTIIFGFSIIAMKQPDGLLSVLLDANADEEDRIEATHRLHEYESKKIEEALEYIIFDFRSSDELIESCKDTLFLIKKKKGVTS